MKLTATKLPSNQHILVNSVVAFVLAGMVATTLHELSHLTAGLLLGHPGRLYVSAVDTSGLVSTNHLIIIALTGPLFSLVFGILFIFMARNWGQGFGRLFWLWLGFLSAQIGFGYFIISPFASMGDTGKALSLLHAPALIYIISFLFGVSGMIWLGKRFATPAVAYTTDTSSLRTIGLFSWLIGTGLLLCIEIPANRMLPTDLLPTVIAGTATIGIFTPLLTFFYKSLTVEHEQLTLGKPIAGLACALLFAVLLLFVLSHGIKIG